MKVKYGKEVDVLRIVFSEKKIVDSEEIKSGLVLDYDKNDNLIAIEILNASKVLGLPTQVDFEIV